MRRTLASKKATSRLRYDGLEVAEAKGDLIAEQIVTAQFFVFISVVTVFYVEDVLRFIIRTMEFLGLA